MAKFIYALNVSLDGYVDHLAFDPDPLLFRHFIEEVRGTAGSIYGRRMYETMRYWDDDQPEWDEAERDYAAAWRRMPKWVVSQALTSVGPNATLIDRDLEAALRQIKAQVDGPIEVAGPQLARYVTELGLIDEYQLYFHPGVLGSGKPYFTAPPPRLRLVAHERVGAEAIRLTYVPA